MQYRSLIVSLILSCISFYAKAESWKIITSGEFQGLATASGEIVIPPIYDAIGWSDGGTEVVGNVIGFLDDDKWGLVSTKNKQLTDADFTILIPFDHHNFRAAIKGKFSNQLFYGLINLKGQVIVDFKYFSLDHFQENLLLVSEYRNRSAFYGIIDSSGQSIVEKSYSHMEPTGELIMGVLKNKKKLFTKSGQSIFDFWLDEVVQKNGGFLVSKDGKLGFVESSGEVSHDVNFKSIDHEKVIPFRAWQMINLTNQQTYHVTCDSLSSSSNGFLTAHINHENQLLNPSLVQFFENPENSLINVHKNHLLTQDNQTLKWSLYKEDGTPVVADMDSIVLDSSYVFAQHNKRWDVYNYYGRKINERTLEALLGAQNRNIAAKNHGYWGWIDFNGNSQIKYRFDNVKFGARDNQFMCQYIGKWGVSNFEDEYIITPNYDKIEIIGGFYVASRSKSKKIFSFDGDLIYQTADVVMGDRLLILKDSMTYGAIFPNGQVTPLIYESIDEIGDFYLFDQGDFMSLRDLLGNEIISAPEKLQKVYDQSEGYLKIKKDGQFGFVDLKGKLRIANRYDNVQPFSEGHAAVKLIGKWGFVNTDEKLVVQPFYEEVSPFQDGLSIVRIDDQFGLINTQGEEVIAVEWKEIDRQPTGNFVVTTFDNTVGLVNRDGATILSPIFESLSDSRHGLVVASKYGKKGVLNYEGYSKHPFEYDDIQIKGDFVLLLKERGY